jgi:hypothetical protein
MAPTLWMNWRRVTPWEVKVTLAMWPQQPQAQEWGVGFSD